MKNQTFSTALKSRRTGTYTTSLPLWAELNRGAVRKNGSKHDWAQGADLNVDVHLECREIAAANRKADTCTNPGITGLSIVTQLTALPPPSAAPKAATNLQAPHLCLLADLMVHLLQLHAQLLLPFSRGQLLPVTSHIRHGQPLPWGLEKKEISKKKDLYSTGTEEKLEKGKGKQSYLSLKRPWEGIFWCGEYGEPPQPPWVS